MYYIATFNSRIFFKVTVKQNPESTEGCSKYIVQKKDWSQQVKYIQVPNETDQVSGGVSVPYRHSRA